MTLNCVNVVGLNSRRLNENGIHSCGEREVRGFRVSAEEGPVRAGSAPGSLDGIEFRGFRSRRQCGAVDEVMRVRRRRRGGSTAALLR